MTPGIGFALGAMICFGLGDLVYKRAAALGIESRQFIMLQAWALCPSVTLYAWATGTLVLSTAALWGSLAGLFSLVAFYNFARSLQDGAVSTNAPIFRLNFTLTAALAIVLLGEAVTGAKLGALALALVAVWLLLAEPGAGQARPTLASMTRVLIATAALGFANFFYKIGLLEGVPPETMLATQAWAFCSMATLFNWLREGRFIFTPGAWRYSTPAAVALAGGFLLLLHGLAIGPASILVPVAQLSFVFTAVAGALLFRERLNLRKRIGLLVAAAALGLFAIG